MRLAALFLGLFGCAIGTQDRTSEPPGVEDSGALPAQSAKPTASSTPPPPPPPTSTANNGGSDQGDNICSPGCPPLTPKPTIDAPTETR